MKQLYGGALLVRMVLIFNVVFLACVFVMDQGYRSWAAWIIYGVWFIVSLIAYVLHNSYVKENSPREDSYMPPQQYRERGRF